VTHWIVRRVHCGCVISYFFRNSSTRVLLSFDGSQADPPEQKVASFAFGVYLRTYKPPDHSDHLSLILRSGIYGSINPRVRVSGLPPPPVVWWTRLEVVSLPSRFAAPMWPPGNRARYPQDRSDPSQLPLYPFPHSSPPLARVDAPAVPLPPQCPLLSVCFRHSFS